MSEYANFGDGPMARRQRRPWMGVTRDTEAIIALRSGEHAHPYLSPQERWKLARYTARLVIQAMFRRMHSGSVGSMYGVSWYESPR